MSKLETLEFRDVQEFTTPAHLEAHALAGAASETSILIPASDYLAPEQVVLEKKKMWPKVWQIACRLEEIPRVGDFVNFRIFDESILITRTAPDRIQAFYNVCQHRGRQLRDEERGRTGKLWFCRWHGWRYNLDGSIAYVHDRKDWEDYSCPLNDAELSLKEARVDSWGGWVFINQDPNSEPLRQYLSGFADRIDPFETENMRILWHDKIIMPANWKATCEVFAESYHAHVAHISGYRNYAQFGSAFIEGRHGGTLPRQYTDGRNAAMEYKDPATGAWIKAKNPLEIAWAVFRYLHTDMKAIILEPLMAAYERLKDEAEDDFPPEKIMPRLLELHKDELANRGVSWPKNLTNEAMARAGNIWMIFPNIVMVGSPDGSLWYRASPNGDDPNSCVLDIWSLGRFASGQEPEPERNFYESYDAYRGQSAFLDEDITNLLSAWKGMQSRGYVGSRVNPRQEGHFVHFHRVLRAYCHGDGWKQSLTRPNF